MGLNSTPSSERIHIGFFGLRNAGKSSLVNAVTGQKLSLVSDIKGTTTDPVQKAMELLPLGAVVIIDTPGFDDDGILGSMRVERTRQTLSKTDIAVLVVDSEKGISDTDRELLELFKERNIPHIIAFNKCDTLKSVPNETESAIYVSALDNTNIGRLKDKIASFAPKGQQKRLVGDLIEKGDVVILVTPIDESAPKGRLILPQQQTIRDILESGAINIVIKETELQSALDSLSVPPKMVITDSQAFSFVSKIVPESIPLTSFSILFARYKGELSQVVGAAQKLDSLSDGDTVLISEGCTHHRQCNDIGSVKIPNMIKKYTGKNLNFEYTSGGEFPDDFSKYALVIHCGGCMLNEREMKSRLGRAHKSGVPMTNYGIAIAKMTGILDRSIEVFEV